MNSAVMSTDFTASLNRNFTAPLNRVKRWRIHIGAHKTATTHLQQTLTAIRPRLVARGVDSIPLAALRAGGLARSLNEPRLGTRLPLLRGLVTQRLVDAILDPLRQGPETLVLSEEKLLGAPRKVFAEPFYPMVEHIVPALATLGGKAEVTLFLSIRAFTPSCPRPMPRSCACCPRPRAASMRSAAGCCRGRRAGSTWSGASARPRPISRSGSGARRITAATGGRSCRPWWAAIPGRCRSLPIPTGPNHPRSKRSARPRRCGAICRPTNGGEGRRDLRRRRGRCRGRHAVQPVLPGGKHVLSGRL